MTPEQLAFVAGCVWLDSGVRRSPDPNDLASIADRLDPKADSLAVVMACVEIAKHVDWVLACRERAAQAPQEVPTW